MGSRQNEKGGNAAESRTLLSETCTGRAEGWRTADRNTGSKVCGGGRCCFFLEMSNYSMFHMETIQPRGKADDTEAKGGACRSESPACQQTTACNALQFGAGRLAGVAWEDDETSL